MKSKRSDFVKSTLLVVLVVWCLGAFFATPVAADAVTPGTYVLFDHPASNLTGAIGPYGLRMDFLTPPDGDGPVFSVSCVDCSGDGTQNASVKLEWTGLTAVISGSLWNWTTSEMWSVDYTLTGLTTVAKGFTATGGNGLLTPPSGPATILTGKQDHKDPRIAFYFLADGHRLPGDNYTIVGRGWLVGDDTNDWIVTAKRVPEPATLFLLGPGLLMGIGFFRKRIE